MPTAAVEILLRARDEASAAINQVAGRVGSLQGGIAALAGAAGGLGLIAASAAAVGGALFAAGRQFANTVEQLERLHQRTGISTERLQVIQEALHESGGDAEGMAVAITKLNIAIAEGNPLLGEMGIKSKDTYAVLRQLVAVLGETDDKARASAITMKLFGRSGNEMRSDFKTLNETLETIQATMGKGIFNEDMKRSAKELDKTLDEAGRHWNDFYNGVIAGAAASTNAVVQFFERWSPQGMLDARRAKLTKEMAQGRGIVTIIPPAGTPSAIDFARGAHMPTVSETTGLQRILSGEFPFAALPGPRGAGALASDLTPDKMVAKTKLRFSSDIPVMIQQWADFTSSVSSSSGQASAAMSALFSGLDSGLNTVFQNLLTQGQTFKTALVTVFKSLVSEILSALARLAAAKLFQFLISLLPGGIAATAGASGGVDAIVGGGGAALASAEPARGGIGGTGNVFIINAIDSKSVLESLLSPTGSMRRATDRIAETRAAT